MGDKRPYKPRKPGAGRKPLKPNYDAVAILQEQMEAAVALYTNNSLQTIADTLSLNPIRFSISAESGFQWLECRPQLFEKQQPDTEPEFDTEQQKAVYWIKHFLEKGDMSANEMYCRLDNEDVTKRVARMDLIICASISRFARNFSDCMTQITALKTMHPAHPIGVYFETENIYTLNPNSQYNLDIQALLADWESGNKSRRMILSYDQRIMTGQYPVADLMGYRHTKDGQLVIEPEEAKTVRFIFLAFIQGYNYDQIAMILTQKKRSTLRGRQEWNGMMVANIMKNERRWGDLEARKSIVVDYKLGKVTKNNGNRCSAYVPEHHEAIVSPEIARAAHLVASSNKKYGVQDIVVIQQGALKGFVSIHPNWSGINAESVRSLCLNAYLPEEVQEENTAPKPPMRQKSEPPENTALPHLPEQSVNMQQSSCESDGRGMPT